MAKKDPKERLRERIASVELRLVSPKRLKAAAGVEGSIDHAVLQIEYWTLRQALASAEARDVPVTDENYDLARHRYLVEARKCTEMAAEWERRKGDATAKLILRKLEDIERKMSARSGRQDQLGDIETK